MIDGTDYDQQKLTRGAPIYMGGSLAPRSGGGANIGRPSTQQQNPAQSFSPELIRRRLMSLAANPR